jgi:hypothetical protein
MTVPGNLSSPLLATAGAGAATPAKLLQRSVRFSADDGSYLSRTPSSAGNRKTWTWAGWVKLGKRQTDRYTLFECTENFPATGNPYGLLNIAAAGVLGFGEASGGAYTTAQFRDPASWYHIVAAMDTTQSTAADRLKLYVNGVQYSHSGYTFTQNADTAINQQNVKHSIGREENSDIFKADLLMADVYFIDGQQLDPTSFGSFDSNGVWQCAAYDGTFGTNGFHLFDFENESGIGNDASGNNNDFTANNLTELVDLNASVYGNFASGSLAGAFDGSTASGDRIGIRPNGSGVSFTAQTVSSKLRVYCGVESGQGTLYINKTINTGEAPSRSSPQYVDVTSDLGTLPFTLTDVGFHAGGNGAGADIYAIEVDDTVLVNTAATSDVSRDVPTNGDASDDTGTGGELSSNYCTWNPLDKDANLTHSNGNLEATEGASGFHSCRGTMFFDSGKWWWEVTLSGGSISGGGEISIGVATNDVALDVQPGSGGPTGAIVMWPNGGVYKDGSSQGTNSTYTIGDTIGLALDQDNHTLAFYKNGTLQSTSVSSVPNSVAPFVNIYGPDSSTTLVANFGQRPYKTSAPSGYKVCATSHITASTIGKGSSHFTAVTYTGDGQDNRTVTASSLTTVGATWIKIRNATDNHRLGTVLQGGDNFLSPNLTGAENEATTVIRSFSGNSFNVGTDTSVNNNTKSHVAWCWDFGSSNVSNTTGSINSTCRTNAAAGMSLVGYTGTGSAATVGHSLGAVPEYIIIKNRDRSKNWIVYHSQIPTAAEKSLNLNENGAVYDTAVNFNDTPPTSTVFSVGTGQSTNSSGEEHIALCFTPIKGFSAVGKYVGNGSTDQVNGPFAWCGFKPAFVMIKADNGGGDAHWVIIDNKRVGYNANGGNPVLYPNRSTDEYGGDEYKIYITSTGFKLLVSFASGINFDNTNHYWIAFAEHPFQANGGLAR